MRIFPSYCNNHMKESNRRTFIKTSSLSLGVLGATSLISLATDTNAASVSNQNSEALPFEEIVINLWPDGSNYNGTDLSKRPKITIYKPKSASKNLAAIVVCPGGGYGMLADHEGAPLAQLFAKHGIVSAVLTYRVAPNQFPAPYADAVRAMRIMRSKAQSMGVDPDKIGIMGFSAGGHLASTVATQPSMYKDPMDDLAESVSAQPNRVILGYPVITFGAFTHAGSVTNLLGDHPDETLRNKFSSELHVSPSTPPTFIFHTADDAAVPVQNAFLFAEACVKQKVDVALHIYPKGRHGVGMALDNPALSGWTEVLLKWLGDWQSV